MVGLVPVFNVFGRAGAVFLGLALLIEGVNRLLDKSRSEAESRPGWHVPTPDLTREFGAIKAVFMSRNSLLDSLALCCVALTAACGGAWLLNWMTDGVVHPKLIVCLLIIPIVIGYTVYRSVRLMSERQYLIICDHGMHMVQGNSKTSFAWTDVKEFTAAHLGDMIDEDAIEIELTKRVAKTRFTRAQFPRLETLWERIVQEANEYVDSGDIRLESVNRAAQK